MNKCVYIQWPERQFSFILFQFQISSFQTVKNLLPFPPLIVLLFQNRSEKKEWENLKYLIKIKFFSLLMENFIFQLFIFGGRQSMKLRTEEYFAYNSCLVFGKMVIIRDRIFMFLFYFIFYFWLIPDRNIYNICANN